MTSWDEIRAQYIATLSDWYRDFRGCETRDCSGCRDIARRAVEALDKAGQLPTQRQQLPGHGRWRYVTAWQDPEVTE